MIGDLLTIEVLEYRENYNEGTVLLDLYKRFPTKPVEAEAIDYHYDQRSLWSL